MVLIDGRAVAGDLLEKCASRISELNKKNVRPKLVVILVGEDPASQIYVDKKEKACKKAGIISEKLLLDAHETSTEALLNQIQKLNLDDSVHGILVQLPLPAHIDTPKVIKAISPAKDVDGFTAYNLGKMFLNKNFEHLVPCTPKGIIKLLEAYNIEIEGKEAVIVGASNLVGKPMATMLLNREATVTVCHIKTKDLAFHTKRADILVVAVGKPNLITGSMVKDGAVVIDVGINRLENGKVVGDTNFEELSEKTSYITPVPGGVGPMTVGCLIDNVITAAERQTTTS